MRAGCKVTGEARFRDRTLFLEANKLVVRASEFVALGGWDIARARDGSGMVSSRRLKTDYTGQRSGGYLSPDALQALIRWCPAVRIMTGGLGVNRPRSCRRGGGRRRPCRPGMLSTCWRPEEQWHSCGSVADGDRREP